MSEASEILFDRIFSTCNACGRKRLDLTIKQFTECDLCRYMMKQKFDPLYYLDTECGIKEL
jgi:hypothetical protein